MALRRLQRVRPMQRAQDRHADARHRLADDLLVIVRAELIQNDAGNLHIRRVFAISQRDGRRTLPHGATIHDEDDRRLQEPRDVRRARHARRAAVVKSHDAFDDG